MQSLINVDLLEEFIESVKSTTASVELIHGDSESLNQALLESVGEEMVILSEPDYLSPNLFSIFKLNKNVITHPSKEQFSNVKIGITDAFCAIASTGSICVSLSKNLNTPASMLTRKHIAIVDSSTILSKPRDIFSNDNSIKKILLHSFSIITGPSATADMGPLVRGVHGPGKLHIIILE